MLSKNVFMIYSWVTQNSFKGYLRVVFWNLKDKILRKTNKMECYIEDEKNFKYVSPQ
jgi:hypothetical protein